MVRNPLRGMRRISSSTASLRLTLLAASLALPTSPVAARDFVWVGGDGDWADRANWSPTIAPQSVVPTTGDSVRIDSGTLTSSTSRRVVSLDQRGGTIAVGALYVDGLVWTGGAQAGGATWVGGTTILGDASRATTLQLGVGDTHRSLNLGGSTTFYNVLNMSAGGRITNASGAVFTSRGGAGTSASAIQATGGAGRFENNGTYIQDSGSDVTTIDAAFYNGRTVRAVSGTLRLNLGGPASSAATFTALSGGTIDFHSGSFSLAGSALRAEGGTIAVGTTATVTGNGVVTIDGGSLNASGALAAERLNWIDGAISARNGGPAVTINGSTAIGDGIRLGTQSLESGRLVLKGSTTFQSRLEIASGAVVENAAGATFTSKGDVFGGTVLSGLVSGGRFDNAGTFIQDAQGKRTTLQTVFNNTGSVEVRSGSLVLNTSSTSSGSFSVLAGCVLTFMNGRFDLTGASLDVRGGSLDVSAPITSRGDTRLTLGTGVLTGTGGIQLAHLDWTGGAQGGTGSTTVSGTATIGGTGYSTVALYVDTTGRRLVLGGTTSFQAARIDAGYGSVIENAVGATFTSRGDVRGTNTYSNRIASTGAGNTFMNAGTYVQDAKGNSTTIDTLFDNSGSVDVRSGSLVLNNLRNYDAATGTLSGGNFTIGNGTALRIPGAIRSNAATVVLRGTGAIRDSGDRDALAAFATNTEAGRLELRNAAQFTSAGHFANLGTVTIGTTGQFSVGGGAAYTQYDGATRVDGRLTARRVEIHGGSVGGVGTITGSVFNWGGEIAPGTSPGTLTIAGDFTQDAGGALTLEFAGDRQGVTYDWLRITGHAHFGGTLNLRFVDGFLPLPGNSFEAITFASWDGSQFDAINVFGAGAGYRVNSSYGTRGLTFGVELVSPPALNAPVPEPATWGMLLAGLGAMGWTVRRRSQAVA